MGAGTGLLWSLRLARATQEDAVLNKPNTRPFTLTKIKSKTKTLFIQIQVCPSVCPTALRVLEDVGGILGLVAHPTSNTKIKGRQGVSFLHSLCGSQSRAANVENNRPVHEPGLGCSHTHCGSPGPSLQFLKAGNNLL